MDKIDITMIATIRPKILEQTLESFCKNMFTDVDRYNLILNIDPVGEDVDSKEVCDIAFKYFKNGTVHYAKELNFSKAVIWTFSQATSRFVFHLEDDWKLLRSINIDYMIEIMKKNPNLASLRLNRLKSNIQDNDGFIYDPEGRLSLNPTLFNGNFIRGIYSLMDSNLNPEKQLRTSGYSGKISIDYDKDLAEKRGNFISKWDHAIYVKESFDPIVEDIGRKWMTNSKYSKIKSFIKWDER
jgi:hypothetical protein